MKKRAATYVRMSTEHQDYSIANQAFALERYAEDNNMVIVKRFVDAGRSGLTLRGRPGLKNLLLDVVSTEANFDHVLVYDVSRWGRFLDADESAYYEYTCKKANTKVHYCVEPFINDDSVYSSLIKNLKRIMASEYSRELSGKVYAAQIRLAGLGFRQGGVAGYGLRRMLVDKDGKMKGWLNPGDRKGFQSDRILLAAGLQEETDVVRQIFDWFVTDGLSEIQIARRLSNHDFKREWTNKRVSQVLKNPKYMGTITYNRTSGKLRGKRVRNPTEKWVCREGAFEAIVNPELFAKAQQILKSRLAPLTDCQILNGLAALLKRTGRLSTAIINSDPHLPCAQTVTQRFKNLPSVYELIGYTPTRDVAHVVKLQKARGNFNFLGEAIADAVTSGKLANPFTISALKATCPGWSKPTYAVMCALYASHDHSKPVRLQRTGRGQYLFISCQPNRRTRFRALDNSHILERLSQLLKASGRLSRKIIADDRNTPGISTIIRQFKSLAAVYELLGYNPVFDRAGMSKRHRDRSETRGPGIMADAIREAIKSGRLEETFTITALQKSCPGWAYGTYYTLPRQYSKSGSKGAIKLARVGPAEYRMVGG